MKWKRAIGAAIVAEAAIITAVVISTGVDIPNIIYIGCGCVIGLGALLIGTE